jgi:hypothetical protein
MSVVFNTMTMTMSVVFDTMTMIMTMTMSVVFNTIFKDISIISPLSASMVKETSV